MENISIKLEKDFLEAIVRAMKRNKYSTKTEFIREALRDKIEELEDKEVLKNIDKVFGSSKRKTSDEDLHKARKKLEKLYEKKFG